MASLSPFPFTYYNKYPLARQSPFQPRISSKARHEHNIDHPDESTTNNNKNSAGRLDRRNALLKLSSVAAGLSMIDPRKALALPIQAPDLSKCTDSNTPPTLDCCPPYQSKIIDFCPPPPWSPLRIRPAAHSVTSFSPDYIAKYERAVELMKALPADDPRNFIQQANMHCAYCDGGYEQVGFPDLELQVHFSWLFFPWHRLCLYFHERILGKLIGDDTFALPFWNWDHPDGMQMPQMYVNPSSPLYDALRDAQHQPPALIDLDYNEQEETTITPAQQIDDNLKVCMYVRVRLLNIYRRRREETQLR